RNPSNCHQYHARQSEGNRVSSCRLHAEGSPMDTVTVLALVVGILAVVAIVGFARYRASATTEIRGPAGTGLRFGGSTEQRVPTVGEDIKAGKDVVVKDIGGLGARGASIEAGGSVAIVHQSDPDEPSGRALPRG